MSAQKTSINLRSGLSENCFEAVLVCSDASVALSVASNLILNLKDDTRFIIITKNRNLTPSTHYLAMIQSGIIPKPQPAPPLPRVVALSYDWPDAPPGAEGKPDALLAMLESGFLDGYDWAVIDLSGIAADLLPETLPACRARVPDAVAVMFLCPVPPVGRRHCLTLSEGVLTNGEQRYSVRPETVVLSPYRENGQPVAVEVHHLLPLESDGQIRFTPLPWA